MRNEIIQTDKTIEGAIESACQKLGCSREDCEWEILDLPKRGFLGFKNTPAKVRVSVPMPEQPAVAMPGKRPASQPASAPKVPPAETSAPQQRPPRAKAPQRPAAPPKAAEPRPVPVQQPPPAQLQPDEKPTADALEKGELACAYLRTVLGVSGLSGPVEVEPVWESGGVCLKITGEGVGQIIGRRGDTLDSLQYLSSLVANRGGGDYLRVTVDCGDYRQRRRATLEALAKKLSAQVLKTGHNKSLEPMNPFERRIIHATVSNIEGVSSASVGDEPNRRVVITLPGGRPRRDDRPRDRDRADRAPRPQTQAVPTASTPRPDWPDKGAKGDRPNDAENTTPGRRSMPPRGGRGRDGDRRSGGRDRDRRDRPPAYQPTKDKPDTPPTEAENKPLYGKIDLE
ncbi:MAG: Jag N-terminal domain-containing protein [Oscillospiraceae bacterium]|nr:Jag N-terminal domain-containing protein [Oscillospiraceae bacterium]